MTNNDDIDWQAHDREVNKKRAEWRKLKSAELRDRLIFLLDDLAPSKGKYAYLERRTGISAASWQNLYLEKQLPTLEMILAISEYRYDSLAWLITGNEKLTDSLPSTMDKWEKFQAHREWLRESRKNAKETHGN